MREVNTVLGPLPASNLGFTLVHEHISFGFPGAYSDATMYPYDREAVKEKASRMLSGLKEAGVNTLVDCTANDCLGRDPELFAELSGETGVNIICATGLYLEELGASTYWKIRQSQGYDISDEIYQMMKTEITRGIGETQIKAGVIKAGTSRGSMTDYEKEVFRAAAKAQKELGVPIMTHTEGPTMGPEQADFLIDAGANPSQIAIGHMNNSPDLTYYLEVLKRPDVFVSFDRTGAGGPQFQEKIARNVADLIAMGYLERMLLSHDSICTFVGRPFEFREAIRPMFKDWRPDFIPTGFRRLLESQGVTDAQFNVLTVDNPNSLYDFR
jgi:phosphotriesterase-related protein